MTSKSKTKKIVAGVLGLMLSLTLVAGVGAQTANAALSTSQVDAIISLLTSFGADAGTITNVRASLTGGTPTAPTTGGATMGTGYTFTRNLKQGDTGEDVKQLQMVLNANGYGPTSGAGSSGNETTYFGAVTKAGVVKFQNKYAAEILTPVGLTSGTGFVGASTRALLNSLGGTTGTVSTGTGTTGTGTTGTGTVVVPSIRRTVRAATVCVSPRQVNVISIWVIVEPSGIEEILRSKVTFVVVVPPLRM